MTAACGCPTGAGRQVTDPARHADWHTLVIEQGGPVGEVSLATLRAARGGFAASMAPTVLDRKAEASGKRVPGWRREAARDDG